MLVKPFEPQMVIARVRELLVKSGRAAASQPAVHAARDISPAGSTTDSSASTGPSKGTVALESGGSRAAPIMQSAATAQSDPLAQTAPATQSASAAQPAPRSATVDDYFARLDAAFATLNVPLDVPRSAHSAAAVDRGAPTAPAAAPELGQTQSPSMPPVTLGDAFGVLLDVEQGEPMPSFGESWQPLVNDDLVDAVARRVTERIGEHVIRELAPDIVSRIAERLVREEIERLKSLPA